MTTATKQCSEVPPLSNKELIINQILSIKEVYELVITSSQSESDKESFASLRNKFKAFFSDEFIDNLGLLDDYKIVNNTTSGLGFIPALSFNSDKFNTNIYLRAQDVKDEPAFRIILNLPEWDNSGYHFNIPSQTSFPARQQYLISAIGKFLATSSFR